VEYLSELLIKQDESWKTTYFREKDHLNTDVTLKLAKEPADVLRIVRIINR